MLNHLPVESRLRRNETWWAPSGPVSVKYRDGHFGGSPKTVLAELMVSLCQIFVEKDMLLKMCHLSGFYSASIQDRTQCCFENLVFFCLWLWSLIVISIIDHYCKDGEIARLSVSQTTSWVALSFLVVCPSHIGDISTYLHYMMF